MLKHLVVRISLLTLLAAGMSAPPAARAASAETNRLTDGSAKPAGGPGSPTELMNADGTLNLEGDYSGALDLSGWNVQIDPERGPVFSLPGTESPAPLSTASLGQWADLGGGNGALTSEVHAIAVMGSDVIIGGHFTNVDNNPAADYIARWDGASWHNVGIGFSGEGSLTSSVSALAVDGTDLYAAGWFCGIYNSATYISDACRVAMWDGSNWSGVGTGGGQAAIGGPVYSLALDGTGNLYAGGSFINVKNAAGTPMLAADYVVMWDGSAWSALGSGAGGDGSINNEVHDLAIMGTDVYAGGWFTNANNGGSAVTAADYVAKWNGSTWSELGNDGAGTPNGSLNSVVFSIAVDGTDVYVGGGFFNVKNGLTTLDAADYIARWNGSAWSALGAGSGGNGALNAIVYEVAVSGTNVYAGGSFMDANNGGTAVTEADSIAVFSNVAGGWSALGGDGAGNGSVPCCVTGLAVSGSHVYVGGSFTQVSVPGDVLDEADHLADWDGIDWSPMSAVQGALNDYVYAVAVSGTDVYVGGNFRNISNHGTPLRAADYIARWDGSNWHALGSSGSNGDGSITSTVSSIAVSGTNVYAGGYFGWIYNAGAYLPEARGIAKWDGSNWSALGSDGAGGGSITSAVLAVAVSGSDVYVGGYFQDVIDVDTTVLSAADFIAKWDGANWTALGSGSGGNGSLNGEVRALVVSGSNVYAGGSFYDVNNAGLPVEEADYLAKWDGGNWSALGSDGAGGGALNNAVEALALSGSNLYAGGSFTDVYNAGSPMLEADYIAKWNGSSWSAMGDNGSGGGSLDSGVSAIAVHGSSVYAGGYFVDVTNTDGVPITEADYVAKWDGTTWSALGSDGSTDGSVGAGIRALGLTSTELYAGGYFVNVNNNGAVLPYGDYIAAYGILAPAVPADFDGDGDTDVSVFRTGTWFVWNQGATGWGQAGDIPIAGDYDGDSDSDFAVYRPSTGGWRVKDQYVVAYGGAAGDVPVPGDYDGDGDAGPAIFRPSTAGWYIKDLVVVGYGLPTDIPVPGDYDGDGSTDIAVFRDGVWFIKDQGVIGYGQVGDIPIPGDYNGDGTTDLAVYRPSTGGWRVRNQFIVAHGGVAGDIPVPGDYDSDGDTDVAIYRSSTAGWYIKDQFTVGYGLSTDYPVPARDTNGDGDPYQ